MNNKMNNKIQQISKWQIIRRVCQILSFLLFPGLFSSTFFAIKEIYIAIIDGSFTVQDFTPQMLLLLATLPVTLIMGRFFCGFLCAFGSMGDFIWFISQKIMKRPLKITEKTDAILKWMKYVILLVIVIGLWTLNLYEVDILSNPWNIFGMYATFGGWPSIKYLLSIGGFLLLLIIVGSFFVERLFCRYLCPLGAIYATLSKCRLFHISKKRDHCGTCKLCTSKCTMGIPLYNYDKVTSGDCINCFACIDACKRNNVKANPAPAVASAVSVAAVTGLFYAGNIISEAAINSKYNSQVSAAEILDSGDDMSGTLDDENKDNSTANSINSDSVNQNSGIYIDGTYTGTGQGFRGEIEVSVTVSNGNITDIEVISHKEDERYFLMAESPIISAILETQSSDVDAVSGATFSSEGIKEAVTNALKDAINSDSSEDALTENIMKENDDSSVNTEVENSINDTQNSNDSSNENTDDSTTSTNEETESQGSTSYKDGTYTGTGTGFRGNTEVSVTVTDGKIADITIVSYQDDEQFFVRAEDTIIEEIIANQQVDVDAVTGATFSSNGIMEAVANALGVEYTNTNSSNPGEKGGHGGFGGKSGRH